MLKGLRERPELSGNDFLPLVVRLDDLFAHLRAIQELLSRLDNLRAASLLADSPPVAVPSAERSPAPTSGRRLSDTLETLAARVAASHGKQVVLVTTGLELVPGDYRRVVQNLVIQFVRNAVVHGIEDPGVRSEAGKNPAGLLQMEFKSREHGYELVFQDDGAGIRAELVREKAIALGLVDPVHAEALDQRATLGLIFKAGVSTHDGDDRDAGRGVGLDMVWKTIQEIGGRIAVATVPGKLTRFRVLLPGPDERQDAVA
jgi:signal transduction histidine kinase